MFEWKEVYSVGIPIIDDQHRKLVEIGRTIVEMLDGVRENSSAELLSLVSDLVDYAQYHFQTEEEMMHRFNYSEYAEHRREHKQFTDYLRKFDLEKVYTEQNKTEEALMTFVANWVDQHILGSDAQYKDFLKEKLNIV